MITPGRRNRPETDFERRMRERREQQQTRVGCAVDGCDWPGAEGPAGVVLELARQHRVSAHPELRERGISRKPKKPAKHPSVQTAEDKKIVRDLAERKRPKRAKKARPPRKGRPSLLTPERVAEAVRRHVDGGETLTQIAHDSYVAWGYSSPKMCASALSRELRRSGVEIRRGITSAAPSRLSPTRYAACKRLYLTGISTTAIGALVWERYGYTNAAAAGTTLAHKLRGDGVDTGRVSRATIPELNRREAEEIIEAAERHAVAEAA